MSLASITDKQDKLFSNGVLSTYKAISTINVADFYSREGYIFRLTGATGGAAKISLITPAYTTIDRLPLAAIGFDDTPTVILYEAGTASTGGSEATPLNACRCSEQTSLMTAKTGVTYANDGTVLETISASIKNIPSLKLWYLKPETEYIITFSASCNYVLEWAEVLL